MSREIKFRVWDKVNEQMYYSFTGTADELFLSLEGRVCSEDEEIQEDGSRLVYRGYRMTPLQYTGLKDKNGKEIYEGDIVRYLDAYDCSTESGYDYAEFDNTGVIEWEDVELRYSVTNRETIDLETFWESEHIEVIGNIYENPELLEGAAQ